MPDGTKLLLIDNDAFILLAGAGHIEAAVVSLGFSLGQCRRLPTLPFVFDKKIARKLQPDEASRVRAAIDTVGTLEDDVRGDIRSRFVDKPEIDAGEVVLFSALASSGAALLSTNDKRAMKAVASLASDPPQGGVAGRVICCESIIKKLVIQHGVASIGPGFAGMGTTNAAMNVCFSQSCLADQSQCIAALDSYINELERTCGAGFLYTP